ncbi:rhodanese-like domain-containing protein 4A, chloroplastic isoform X2 [Cornus florida]|uniref:rhodanese-like domain-containing protein 4A, chloroplastic isoform X2 n=1 Tax=Cornus florida TaxID=4283 RepID=UPI00289E98D1|nr:rhodanese-like domain-containing protein 4A, chloroplastic isoform X2 [Cornus florida]
MESLSIGVSSSPPFPNHPKTHKPTSQSILILSNSLPNSISTSNSTPISCNSHQTKFLFTMKNPNIHKTHTPNHQPNKTSTTHFLNLFKNHPLILKNPSLFQFFLKPHISFLCMGLSFPLSCFASETSLSTEEVSSKINLESILVSIDDFFNRNPFFVAGVTFIWLVVIPLTQEYLEKFKFVSAIDGFRKLRDDPNCQLLDIRDKKNLKYLGSPNLKYLNKSVVQVEFCEGDEGAFVKKVMEKFPQPADTTICILDSFDGNSIKVAELLFKKGFKEAYAIRGGVRGKNGWQEIQETLLPPSVHIYPTKKVKKSQQLEINGEVNQGDGNINQVSSFTNLPTGRSEQIDNGYVNKSIKSTPETKQVPRSKTAIFPNSGKASKLMPTFSI